MYLNLGPHPPRLWPEDAHDIWRSFTEQEGLGAKLHHRDELGVALRRLEKEEMRRGLNGNHAGTTGRFFSSPEGAGAEPRHRLDGEAGLLDRGGGKPL